MLTRSRVSFLLMIAFAAANGADAENERGGDKSDISVLRATVEQLRNEVATLRGYVMKLELERRRDTIRQTKAELEKLRQEHLDIAELNETRQQDLRDIEQHLTREDLQPPERLELEATRAELAVARGRDLDQQSEAARSRESELLRRLESENFLAKRLEEAIRATGGKTP
jgi:hypothetical protein